MPEGHTLHRAARDQRPLLVGHPVGVSSPQGRFAEGAALLERYAQAAQAAHAVGLGVNAGHDLNRDNLGDFLRAVPDVAEVSIGHAIAADALELGMAETVRAYQRCIRQAQGAR